VGAIRITTAKLYLSVRWIFKIFLAELHEYNYAHLAFLQFLNSIVERGCKNQTVTRTLWWTKSLSDNHSYCLPFCFGFFKAKKQTI